MVSLVLRVAVAAILGIASSVALAGGNIDHGRYLSIVAGCNDCHTPGWLMSGGKVAEKDWLTGGDFGWHGPWGTTYAANLRLLLPAMTEAQWVAFAHALKARPPMPVWELHEMTAQDLRDLHAYVVSLGPAGKPAPAYVPPGGTIETSWVDFDVRPPPKQ